jgi:hypothetical protein
MDRGSYAEAKNHGIGNLLAVRCYPISGAVT